MSKPYTPAVGKEGFATEEVDYVGNLLNDRREHAREAMERWQVEVDNRERQREDAIKYRDRAAAEMNALDAELARRDFRSVMKARLEKNRGDMAQSVIVTESTSFADIDAQVAKSLKDEVDLG